jgi:hypothetical protein
MSKYGDTAIQFERNFLVETTVDASQYEAWEAHLDLGLVVFTGGHITIFPPAATAKEGPR